MSLKGDENDHHVVVELTSFREDDGHSSLETVEDADVPKLGIVNRKQDVGVGYVGIEGHVEDIEKFANDSFHITMTDTDDMHLKHRHPHEKTNNDNNIDSSTTTITSTSTTGSHVNQGYAIEESGDSYSSQNSVYLYGNEGEHEARYSLANRHDHDKHQQLPQVFHMDVYTPSPNSLFHLPRQVNNIEDLEEGILSPTYVTPPTSPPPPPSLQVLSLSSSSSEIREEMGRKEGDHKGEPPRHLQYMPTSFIEDEEAGRNSSSSRLDQSFNSVQFDEVFYPNFFKTFYLHFVDASIDNVIKVNQLSCTLFFKRKSTKVGFSQMFLLLQD